MSMEKGAFGTAIKKARIEKALTQEKLAEMLDVTPMHLKNMESERRRPSFDMLYKLSLNLDLSVDSLFFPEKNEGQALRRKIEIMLHECSAHELRIISATISAMLDK